MLPRKPRISLQGPPPSLAALASRGSPISPGASRNPNPYRQWSFDAKVRMENITSGSAKSPDRLSADVSGYDAYGSIWPIYNKAADEFDKKLLLKWNEDMDVLLIFAALFSAIVTAFLTAAMGNLQQDFSQISSQLLFQMATNQNHITSDMDPSSPFQPPLTAVIVNCFWTSSLAFSLGASFGAILCKEWFTEYSSGTEPVVQLFRACRRHMRFMAFEKWYVRTFVTLLPTLLHMSVLLFFAGMIVQLWSLSEIVAIVLCILVGLITITYFCLVILPLFTLAPFLTSATVVVHHFLFPIFKFLVHSLNGCRFLMYAISRFFAFAVVEPICKVLISIKLLHQQAKSMLVRLQLSGLNTKFKPHRLRWDVRPTHIDTSPETIDQALLWLLQVPLDLPEADAVVHTLESIASPRFRTFACSPVILFLCVTLESTFKNGEIIEDRFDVARDCVLVLSRIKFHLVVESNSEEENRIGRVTVGPFIAWAAQELLRSPISISAIKLELSAAAAWLSPVEKVMDDRFGEIRAREEYLPVLQLHIQEHAHKKKTIHPITLVNILQSMHAFLPRGSYGQQFSIWRFLPVFSADLNGSWFYDEDVLQALTFYALDLVSTGFSRKWARRGRDTSIGYLVAKLVGYLKAADSTKPPDVVEFLFLSIYKWPTLVLADRKRWPLSDIALICHDTQSGVINSRAMMAYSAILQNALTTNRFVNLIRDIHGSYTFILRGVRTPNTSFHAVYALSMTLKVLSNTEGEAILAELDPQVLLNPLLVVNDTMQPTDDIERGSTALETMLCFKIHTVFVLAAYPSQQTLQVDDLRLTALMERVTEVAMDHHNLRVRWQAIHLAVLLNSLFPRDYLRERFSSLERDQQSKVRQRSVDVVSDWENCSRPLKQTDMQLMLGNVPPGSVSQDAAFEWFGTFPFVPL